MRTLIIHLTSVWLAVSLTGCATVPAQVQLISASAVTDKTTHDGTCLPVHARALQTQQSASALNPQHIALLNWNIYKTERTNWITDFPQFAEHQDIITLQEALLTEPLETALAHHQLDWTLNHAFLYGEHQTGVLTASRISPVSRCGLRTIEPIIRTPKTMLIQTYVIDGHTDTLLVANIHGINFSLGTESYTAQLTAVRDFIRHHSGPVILAGDFNNWSETRTAILNGITDELQLHAIPYQNHNRTRVFGHVIDHVYYRGMEVIAHDNPEVSSSDHNPIRVIFRLPSDHRLVHITTP